jgi:periplasmic protein TonB
MTLIPMLSSVLSARRSAVPAGPDLLQRGGYNPGAGHRPAAAAIAIGLPAALLVAVALSPMIIEAKPKLDPMEGTLITLPKPPPPPPEPTDQALPPQSVLTSTAPVVPTQPISELIVPVLPTFPVQPTADPGPVSVPETPPAPPPKLVLAKLDDRYLSVFQPDYPPREQREGIEGVAKVRVLIGADGKVKQVELVSTDSPGFFEATKRRALAKWRFKPATRGGVAEESWKEMTVRFEIRNA